MTLRKTLGVCLAILFAASTLSAFQAKPADLSGTWTGTLTPAGGQGGSAHIVLKQNGTELTGTCGPTPEQQTAIANGKVTTAKGVTSVTFEASPGPGGVMKFDLKVVDGRLKGNVALERNGQKQEGTLDVGRAK
ncbi:MAG TPA: hypothetical protein VJN96_10170 [Vicinamibacterales bacterium]|nr:hypothetical protein [Vicinamibacterales bacterium]